MDGFSQDTLDFLKEVREQNSKEWFKENKDRYLEFLIEPLQGFVRKLSKVMYTIDEEFELAPSVIKQYPKLIGILGFQRTKLCIRIRCGLFLGNVEKAKRTIRHSFLRLRHTVIVMGWDFF